MYSLTREVIERNKDGEIEIVQIFKRTINIEPYENGLRRMMDGPIDSRGGKPYGIAEIISKSKNICLLYYNPYSADCDGLVIGFCELEDHNCGKDILLVKEFEIFHEYRRLGYGTKFMHKLVDDNPNKAVCPYKMSTKTAKILWKASDNGEMIYDEIYNIMEMHTSDICDEENSTKVRLGMLEECIKILDHDGMVCKIYRQMANYMLDSTLRSTYDICRLVENSKDFINLLKH